MTFESNLAENYKFKLPELRVGTLDSLMVLSDDLVKTNTLVEAVVNKLRRQLFDLQSSGERAAMSPSRAAALRSGCCFGLAISWSFLHALSSQPTMQQAAREPSCVAYAGASDSALS